MPVPIFFTLQPQHWRYSSASTWHPIVTTTGPGREPLLWPGNNASAAEQQAWRERRQARANGLLKLPESA